MQSLTILLLGPPEIILDGKPVKTDRHKAIGMLAYLAVEDKSHSRQALAALFWPDYPRASAYSYLRRTLWELNQMLGKGWVEANRENVTLARKTGLEVDAEVFSRLISQSSDQMAALETVVKLYRGEFLEGLVVADTPPFEEWQTQLAEVYRRELGRALEKLVERYEGSGAFELALGYARRWLALDPLNEAPWRAIIRQMMGMDDRAGAIRAYQACAQTLKDELDVPPQAETEQLYQAIVRGEQKTGQRSTQERVAEEGAAKIEGNLPIPTTPFIGRSAEIEQVTRLTLDPQIHLLTLVGPGGTGKTRLAIQAAAEMAGSFKHGAWFVPLASAQSTEGIIAAIAAGFNFSFYKGEVTQREQLLDYLRDKNLLLVLDNFEHLVEGGRELAADIAGAAWGVKLMVTSRQRLNLQHEQVYQVPGMATPDLKTSLEWDHPEEQAQAFSAIQLLVERAKRVRAEFQLTKDNLKPITRICQLVDGSPLGIELAAAWLEVLPEAEIAREISTNLDFLESSAVDAPERQRSLRMVFDTSWRLLDPDEQQAFRRLCAFRGSFSREAAQAVSGAGLRTLLSLANKSWLQQNDKSRFILHEVLKQYGIERLKADPTEWHAIKERQAEYFCAFMELQGNALHSAEQIQALRALKPELESNIPDAWEWLISQGRMDQLIKRILPGVFYYWLIQGVSIEFFSLIKQAQQVNNAMHDSPAMLRSVILEIAAINAEVNLFLVDEHPKERLEQLWARVYDGNLQDELGFWYIVLVSTYSSVINYQEGARRLAEILEQSSKMSDSWEVGNYYLLAALYSDTDQPEIRNGYLHKALEIFEKLGVIQERGATLSSLGSLAAYQMDYEKAIVYTLAAQALYEQVGDVRGIDSTWTNLGEYYIFLGRIEQALHAFEELRHYSERMGNRRILGTDLSWESLQISRYGKLEFALELRQRSLAIAHEVGNQFDIAWATWELGEIYRLLGKTELARKYYYEAQPAFDQMGELIGLGFFHRGLGDIAAMQEKWREAHKEYETALVYHEREQRGNREWGLSLTHARLGTAFVHLNELGAARQHLKTSLALALDWSNPDLKSVPLVGIAGFLLADRKIDQAVELATCVASNPTTWNEVKGQARAILEQARESLPGDDARRLQEKGEKMTLDEACKKYGEENSF